MERERKFDALRNHALQIRAIGITMTFSELIAWLNRNDFKIGGGTPYSSPRGVARLVRAAYDHAYDELDEAGADPIARAFTNRHGGYAYEK